MPELPEVETVVRLVRPDVVGRTVTGATVGWERSLGGVSARAFRRGVTGRPVEGVRRRGKHFVIALGGDRSIVGHLRMTGRLVVRPRGDPPGPYARVSLALDDGCALDFVDVRKFGRFVLTDEPDALLAALGPEPLDGDFTAAWLHGALRSRKRALKPLLLDQTFLAGLGNIYVDESLFCAGLHPLRRSDRVPRAQSERLWSAIREILSEAIAREGSSFDTFYRTPEGQPGSYQHQFRVYGRHGKPCRVCERPVKRIVVGQRGTHLCTRCQPAPRKRR